LEGLVAPEDLVVLWGQPKSGKSFLALRLAYGLALGQGMWGKSVPRPLRALYVAAEGAGGMGARLRALRQALGDDHGRFAIIAQLVTIGPPAEDAESLLQAAKAHCADLVVVDTLARTFGEGNEDSARDMGLFIQKIDAIRHETGAAVVVVHHGPKAEDTKTPRGSGALMGAADIILQVKKGAEGAPIAALVQAVKDDKDGAELPFRLEVVTVGQREDGSALQTCLAVEAESDRGGVRRRKRRRRSGAMDLALKILVDIVAKAGPALPRNGDFPSVSGPHGVPKNRWRDECITHGICASNNPDSARRAAERAIQGVISSGAAACRGDLVWPTGR